MLRTTLRRYPPRCGSSWNLHVKRKVARWASLRPRDGRPYATVTNLDGLPEPGEKIHGFTLKRKKQVPELELTALHLEHDKTGAEYLHVARDDRNNVFSIGFKTNPPDDTGVPHILEHTTLCGSQRSVYTMECSWLMADGKSGIPFVTLSSRCYDVRSRIL